VLPSAFVKVIGCEPRPRDVGTLRVSELSLSLVIGAAVEPKLAVVPFAKP